MEHNASERFLKAEEEANKLVDLLAQLDQEANSYRTARQSIDVAASGVADLTERLSECAGRLVAATETLRSIGTPELMSKQDELGTALSSTDQDVTAIRRSLAELAASVKSEELKHTRLTQWTLGLLLANSGLLVLLVVMARQ